MRSRLPILLLPLLLVACAALGVPLLPIEPADPSAPTPHLSEPPITGIVLTRSNAKRLSPDADPKPAAAAMNAFGVDLYARLATTDANLVFSPSSVEFALAMLRPGARGETANQMDTVMHAVGSNRMAASISALQSVLGSRSGSFENDQGESVPVAVRIANSAFVQRDLSIAPEYLDALSARFGAGIGLVDYKASPDAVRVLINQWVARRTEDRIRDLLAPGSIDALTRLVLANAIYLKAPWLVQFDKDATADGSFTRADGSSVQVPLMHARDSFGYAEGPGWQVVDLPYVGGSLSMTIILPEDLSTFDASLTPARLDAIVASLSASEVQLALPRWDIETKTDLPEQLSAMGMPLAFDAQKADFSGITTDEQLSVTDVVHQANITVDEAGTEAAAATAVVVGATGIPSDVTRMTVDHPFLFAVRDDPTGTILFLGRVTDPSASR